MRGLLILAALVAWRWYQEKAGGALGGRTVEAINAFKAKLAKVAKEVEAATGISARLGIYQASLESGYGGSELSRPTAKLTILPSNTVGPANNIFGFKTGEAWIKAGRPYVMMPTWDYYRKGQKMPNGEIATKDGQALKWPSPFRAYASWDDSYRDWARLLQTPTYVADGTLTAVKKDALEEFGKALGIHYAPNQNYASRLAARAKEMGDVA